MIEIPEAKAFVRLAKDVLVGRTIDDIEVMNSPNKFCWMNLEAHIIHDLLIGNQIKDIKQSGHYVRFLLADDIEVVCAEDIIYSYVKKEDVSEKNQLVLMFDHGYALEIKVKLYGFILIGKLTDLLLNHQYFKFAYDSIEVLSKDFTFEHFKKVTLFDLQKGSIKQALATNQHIPGLGNGILHDILFDAKIRPDRKLSTVSNGEYNKLYQSVIAKIDEMTLYEGRDLQVNLFGEKGKYQTIMHAKRTHCPLCSHELILKSFLGGKVIYCPSCQL